MQSIQGKSFSTESGMGNKLLCLYFGAKPERCLVDKPLSIVIDSVFCFYVAYNILWIRGVDN